MGYSPDHARNLKEYGRQRSFSSNNLLQAIQKAIHKEGFTTYAAKVSTQQHLDCPLHNLLIGPKSLDSTASGLSAEGRKAAAGHASSVGTPREK